MATIEFSSVQDAEKAQRRLDGFIYIFRDGTRHPLIANFENSKRRTVSPRFRERNRSPGFGRRDFRSRSPLPRSNQYHSETSKLDMELELLRKQRQVIEEERKLLMERKKLELLKDMDPNMAREFKFIDRMDEEEDMREDYGHDERRIIDDGPDRRYNTDMERGYNRRFSNVKRRSPYIEKHNKKRKLPTFHFPCQEIIKDMEGVISKVGTNKDMVWNLTKEVRFVVRKRLAVALENKEYMPFFKVVEFYRELYPKWTDEILVNKLASEVTFKIAEKNKDEDPWSKINDEEEIRKMDKQPDDNVPSTVSPKKEHNFEEVPRNSSHTVNYANSDSMDAAVSLLYEGDRNWIEGDLENF
ncbi:hypothetical protein EVAR_12157_1 [Eumeta japonica]|uniref:Uncharacterized protein n=1 Tax=Eumeta variegata TaxID=151549 RepID=A0A4C1UHR4_EUMVA|nr:hypothetical protein EVAR_12157_1 [Eumeta japonica]